jgi:ATP-dependent DNA helicase RecG
MPAPKSQSSASKLARLGLHTDIDLALHLPLRYEDETQLITIREAGFHGGDSAQVEGVITSCDIQYRPRRQLVVTIADDSGQLVLRFLNFYGSQTKQLAVGNRVRARGEVRHGFFGAEMIHPSYRIVNEGAPLPVALTPVYPSGEGLSQTYLRSAIAAVLKRVDLRDTLPQTLLARLKLPAFEPAVRLLHNPPPDADAHALSERSHTAWIRMKFDELLAQQLSMKRAQAARRAQNANPMPTIGVMSAAFKKSLPFTLTGEQQRVLAEISDNLRASHPMQRLLQGDVGSGKTIVAALAAAQAIDSGYQVALMAPTEILADQHFRKIASWMEPLGVTVVWLTGSMKKKEKTVAQALIESGSAQLVIGTHALIQDAVQFARLGLVIVDEQHRFGVGQRLSLRNKGLPQCVQSTPSPTLPPQGGGGNMVPQQGEMVPHQLMMSATPIPRTLAMTYYADLDVSVIGELPPGRTPVVTRIVDQQRRLEVIAHIFADAQEGRQAYWVCPLIEESEALQLQTATDTYTMLSEALPDLKIGLVHGRLKSSEKKEVMDAFERGEIHLLVATTVIEVGVDVPNASLMVVENAERFGLSQLHQLRGRVGRGADASVCLLLYQSPLGDTARQRLMTMRETTDGFEIARRDLEIRGPGEFLGARQSGVPMLRFADLATDQWLVEKAQQLADELLNNKLSDSTVIIDAHLKRWLGGREDFLKV